MRILVCDDHQLFAEALGDILTARGHAVVRCSSPHEAAALAACDLPDVCVMDRTFPEGDVGVQAAQAVLSASSDTAVLMLTGHADAAGARAALGAGVRGFLRKDEPLEHVVDALDQLADGMLVVDPDVLRPDARRCGPPVLDALTSRERDVLERIVHGESGPSMAAALGVSYSTMRTHVQNVLAKLGVHSQLEAAAFAVQHSLVQQRAG